MDANLNRVSEGLRTIEDVLRFGYDHAAISAETRRLRHAFGAILRRLIPRWQLLTSRESARDVGAGHWQAGARPRLSDLVCANFHRVQESARVLEEGARFLHATTAIRNLQRLRYRSYGLERKTWMVLQKRGLS